MGNPNLVAEVVRYARDLVARGWSRKRAAAHAGWPLGKSRETPYRMPS